MLNLKGLHRDGDQGVTVQVYECQLETLFLVFRNGNVMRREPFIMVKLESHSYKLSSFLNHLNSNMPWRLPG